MLHLTKCVQYPVSYDLTPESRLGSGVGPEDGSESLHNVDLEDQ